MSDTIYFKRQNRLKEVLGYKGLDGILITNLTNIRYICGFTSETTYISNISKVGNKYSIKAFISKNLFKPVLSFKIDGIAHRELILL